MVNFDYWAQYWQQGALTSFSNDFPGNYSGILKENWQDFFLNLPNTSDLLDLATGNGALALLVQEYAVKNNLCFTVSASDLVKIAPASMVKLSEPELLTNLKKIHFYGGVDSAELPFRAESFDAVVSQYGFEYSNRSQTIKEICRVLRPGGYFRGICHSSTSSILTKNNALLAVNSELMADEQLFMALTNIVELFDNVVGEKDFLTRINTQEFKKLKSDIDARCLKYGIKFPHSFPECGFRQLLAFLFSAEVFKPLSVRRQHIEKYRKDICAEILRLESLIKAAVKPAEKDGLIAEFETSGIFIDAFEVLSDSDKEYGWIIAGRKS